MAGDTSTERHYCAAVATICDEIVIPDVNVRVQDEGSAILDVWQRTAERVDGIEGRVQAAIRVVTQKRNSVERFPGDQDPAIRLQRHCIGKVPIGADGGHNAAKSTERRIRRTIDVVARDDKIEVG